MPSAADPNTKTETASAGGSQGKDSDSFALEVVKVVVAGLKQCRVPSCISLSVGIALVLAFYVGGSSTQPAFDAMADLQQSWGIVFSMVSTCLSAGILPMMLQLLLRQMPKPIHHHVAFNLVFWTLVGVIVDLLYKLNTFLHGEGTDPLTIARKVAFDQFVFNPFGIFPLFTVPLFRWRDCSFDCNKFKASLQDRRGVALQYCSLNLSNWCTWVPGCSVVYSFPTSLQLPIFSIIVFFFSILLTIVSKSATSSQSDSLEACKDGVSV